MMAALPPYSEERFPRAVLVLMRRKPCTFRQLAEATGLSAGYVHHLTNNKRPVPENEVIERFAEALGVQPDYFIEYRHRLVLEALANDPDKMNDLYRDLCI